MGKKPVGKIKHYFNKIGVAVIELSDELKVGDNISIEGSEAFEQKVDSMQIDRAPVESATKGQAIGLKVIDKVREGDSVFKIVE